MALEQAGVQLVAQGANVYISDLNSATKATETFVSGTEKGGGRVSSAGQIMIGALREVGAIAVNALATAAKATAGFVKDSIGLAGDFQSGMLEFQSVAGKDVDTKGLDKFRSLFLTLGKELPVSTSDVQQAAIEMVKGGIDPAIVAAGGLRQNIQFAAAAMSGDLAGAAEISAKILGGWADANATASEKADFLTHSTDLLTKAANASSVDVHELSLGIFNAQGIAKTAGVSFDDLTTTLAAMSPRFASSSEAGNSLKNVIARLQPTTDKAAQFMLDLGLITEDGGNKFYDANGKFVGFQQAAETLKTSLVGLTEQQKTLYLQQIFGNDAMNAAAALADMGAAGYQNMADSLAKANGVQEAAALKQQGFNTALENAKGSLEALQITVGSALLPVLTDLMNNVIAPAVNTLTDLVDAVTGNEEAFTKLSPTMQGVAQTIQGIAQEAQRLFDAFQQNGIGGVIDALLSDIGGAIPEIEQSLGEWGKAFVEWIGPMIPPLLQELGKLIIAGVQWVVAQEGAWLKQLATWAKAFVAWIAPLIPPLLQELGRLGGELLKWIGDQAAPLVQKFLAWKDSFIAWIGPATVEFLAKWPTMFDQFLSWIGDQAGPLLKKLGDWAVSFVAWIIPMIPGFVLTLGEIALALGVFIVETAAALVKKIALEWVPALVGWVVADAIPKLLLALADMVLKMGEWVTQTQKDLAQKIKDEWVPALVDWIKSDGIPKLILALVGVVRTFTDWATSATRDLAESMKKIGTSIVDGIKKGITDAWGAFVSWITEKAKKLVDDMFAAILGGSPALLFAPVGVSMVQGILLGFMNEWPELQQQVANMGEDLAKQAHDIADSAQNAIADGFSGMANIDRQAANNLDKIADIKDAFTRAVVEQDLLAAQKKAQQLYTDPQVAAEYFKMLSDNEFETLAIREKIANASTQVEKDRLNQQLILISDAQRAEENAWQRRQATQTSAVQGLIDQLQAAIFASGKGILDDPALMALQHWIDQLRSVFHMALGGPAKAGQPYWVGERGPELFFPNVNGTVMPAPTSAQLMRAAAQTTYNQQSTAYNMPVYTNQSPAVLQQSFAVMRAGLI